MIQHDTFRSECSTTEVCNILCDAMYMISSSLLLLIAVGLTHPLCRLKTVINQLFPQLCFKSASKLKMTPESYLMKS